MSSKNITFVTGIWDLKRENSGPGFKRSFDHYQKHFATLLEQLKDYNLVVYVEPSMEEFVWERRSKENTKVIIHPKENFSGSFFPFFDKIQEIRQNPDWLSQAGWLRDSTQATMPYYNPMVMSKMFMLHNAKIANHFDDEYIYWIDGGITHTVSLGYFHDDVVIDNLKKISNKFLFVCFPYETSSEIHGFDIKAMNKYAQKQVKRVARGGFFGGHRDYISEANALYYHLLDKSLSEGYMGTEESIFTLMTYKEPTKYRFETIEYDGLIYKFFENIRESNFTSQHSKKINLYFISYNAPAQLKMVLDSFEKYDSDFITKTNLILVNNTLNKDLFPDYEKICEKYNITEYRHDNIGICGGRQWVAKHFHDSDADYMLFFEDDMLLDFEGNCSSGFTKNVPDLLMKSIDIMEKEKYSFLKLCFTEFYGDNSQQWAWHNVKGTANKEFFGDIVEKPQTKFTCIKHYEGVAYAEGEVYYCNWPHVISKEGNQACFMDTLWDYPFEQTWMSHIYKLTRDGKVNPGILLASPFTHNREIHYGQEERREN